MTHINRRIILLMSIYNIVNQKSDITKSEQKRQLYSYFTTNIVHIRQITKTKELHPLNTSMGLLFSHIKTDILLLLSECVSSENKKMIMTFNSSNIHWNQFVFNAFIDLGIKDIPFWYFFHIPYYHTTSTSTTSTSTSYTTYTTYTSTSASNNTQLQTTRSILNQMLDYALDNWPTYLYFTETEFIHHCNQTCLMYAISYHDDNNKPILTKYSQLVRKINPWITYQSPNVGSKLLLQNDVRKKEDFNTNFKKHTHLPIINNNTSIIKKICFITDSFSVDSCVFRDRMGLIGQLFKKKDLDIYIGSFIGTEHITGKVAKLFYNKIKTKYICLDRNLEATRSCIDAYRFDIIIYPDIGMKLFPYLLSYSRLAPIQINTWGHSETSGIDTIDYFITSQYFHPNDRLKKGNIQEDFSEKIVVFNSLSTYYLPPTKLFNIDIAKFRTKKEFGFLEQHKLYGCLQTNYKLNPEFEKCMLSILKKDPNGYILLSNAIPFCQSHLKRIRDTFGHYLNRIHWFPVLDKYHYLEVISICDIILDPFPFGGCNTSFEAFDLNVPVITLPSQYISGNFTTGLYKKMGIVEAIAVSIEDYVNKCVNIVYNEKLRNKIVRDINNEKRSIFLEKESVEDWHSFIMKC